jgi:hypothetical protein
LVSEANQTKNLSTISYLANELFQKKQINVAYLTKQKHVFVLLATKARLVSLFSAISRFTFYLAPQNK